MPHRQLAQTDTAARMPRSQAELMAEAEQFIDSMQTLLRVTCDEIERARACMQCAWDPERCPARRASGQCEMKDPAGD